MNRTATPSQTSPVAYAPLPPSRPRLTATTTQSRYAGRWSLALVALLGATAQLSCGEPEDATTPRTKAERARAGEIARAAGRAPAAEPAHFASGRSASPTDYPPPVRQDTPVQRLADRLLPEVAEAVGLRALRPVVAGEVDRAGMRAMLADDLQRGSKTKTDSRLGAMNVAALDEEGEQYLDSMQDQVLGLYDPASGQLVLKEGLGVAEQERTMRHELTHALQDQHFDLRRLQKAGYGDADRASALTAVLEGQAMVAMEVQGVAPEGLDSGRLGGRLPDGIWARIHPGRELRRQLALAGVHGVVGAFVARATDVFSAVPGFGPRGPGGLGHLPVRLFDAGAMPAAPSNFWTTLPGASNDVAKTAATHASALRPRASVRESPVVRQRLGTPLGEEDQQMAGLIFPYLFGKRFVEALGDEMSLPEVVRLTLEVVPESSREILHPEAYVRGELPVAMPLPNLEHVPGTRVAYRSTLGEFSTRMALGGGPLAGHVAASWRGDAVLILSRNKVPAAAVWASAWRSPAAAERFGNAAVTVSLQRGAEQARDGSLWLNGERFWLVRRGPVVAVVSDVAGEMKQRVFAALSQDLAQLLQ